MCVNPRRIFHPRRPGPHEPSGTIVSGVQLLCVPRLRTCFVRRFGASLNPGHFSPPHKMDILQAPGKIKELGGSGIAVLDRLVAGLDRK
jgi:hypothetical protein